MYKTAAFVSITTNTQPFTQVRTACAVTGVDCFLNPGTTHTPYCLPRNCTADAFASTGALYRKDHLGIFRFGNLRVLACDWLLWPHDNLGRNLSCVLSPSVSLEGSWGVFGGLGRPLSFNITGKQRNGEKKSEISTPLHGFPFVGLSIPCCHLDLWGQLNEE